MKSYRRERIETARHEAGHAVVAEVLEVRVRRVTIRPQFERGALHRSHSDVTYGETIFYENGKPLPFRSTVEDMIVSYAGELAQGSGDGAGEDREAARRSASWYSFGDARAARALRTYARAAARALVKKHRRAIGRVARALLAKETLSGDEVRRIIRASRRTRR